MRSPWAIWMLRTGRRLAIVLAAMLPMLWLSGVYWLGEARSAEPPATQAPVEQITPEDVRLRLKEIEQSEALDDAAKTRLKDLYQQVLGELDLASKRSADAATFEEMIKTAAEKLTQTEDALEEASTVPAVIPPANANLVQLRQEQSGAVEALAKAKEALKALEAEPKRRVARKGEIPGQLTEAREELARIGQKLLAGGQEQNVDPLETAERALLLAQRQRFQNRIAAMEREIAAYDATGDLLRRQRDLAAVQVLQAEAAVNLWSDLVRQRSKEQREDQAEQARLEIDECPEELRPLAEERLKDAQECERIGGQIRAYSDQLAQVNRSLEELQKRYAGSEERVDAAGLTYAVGLILRTQRADLPDLKYYERRRRGRQPQMRDVQLTLFELEDRRAEMASLDPLVQSELEKLGPALGEVDLEDDVRDLLTKQRDQLDTLVRDYEECFEILAKLDEAERLLVKKAAEYKEYIDERVFWIGSTGPLQLSDWRSASAGLSWLASPENWSDLGRALISELEGRPLLNLLAACVFAVLLLRRRRLRRRLVEYGEAAARSTTRSILPTWQALLTTALIAVTWPGLLAYIGWRLANSLGTSEFVGAVAIGLLETAAILLPLELVRQVSRRGGLGEAHFGWPAGALEVVRQNLKWFMLLALPLVFVAATLHAQNNERLDNSLGRIGSMAGLVLVAVYMHRVLHFSGEFYRQMSAAGWEGWPYRLRHLWYATGVLVPLALALLAGLGYYYTAGQLAIRLWESACVPLGLAVVGALLYRWVMLTRRRLAIDRSRQRIAAAAAEEVVRGDAPGPEVDLATVTRQTRRLIHSLLVVLGIVWLWYIWADALPALGILEQVPAWPPSAWFGGKAGAGGAEALITLADVGLLVLVVVMTVIASRNLPGLLEISIPQRLPLDAGARYAITTVSRYMITLVGLVVACSLLGIRWSSVQWLVAALGVGLGFGLQEVFANFICGLILLFERPIRVGDIVTVGDVSGVVSRIQIRATTITNWDRKELIVPNKEFVTGQLLNWTLSDPVNRVVVNVGVGYGSDTERARELLLRIARDHPLIVDDPAPSATFEEFADSSLSLVLRCFLPDLEHRLQVINDLHTAIHKTFAEEGIEIAFPQRDVHLRSGGSLVQIVGQEGARVPPRGSEAV